MPTKAVDKYGCIIPILFWFLLGIYFFHSSYTNCILVNDYKKYSSLITDIRIYKPSGSSPSSDLAYLIVNGEKKKLDLKYSMNANYYRDGDSLDVWCRDGSSWCFLSQDSNKLQFYTGYYYDLLLFSSVFFLPLIFFIIRKILK